MRGTVTASKKNWSITEQNRAMNLIVLGVTLVVASAAGSDCSKEWIKYMLMNACAYSKRHISSKDLHIKRWTMNEVENQFKRMYGIIDDLDGNYDKAKEQQGMGDKKYISKSPNMKEVEQSHRRRMKRLATLNDDFFSIGVLEEFIGEYIDLEERRRRSREKIKRHIRALVEKCCKVVCTVEDFRGICH